MLVAFVLYCLVIVFVGIAAYQKSTPSVEDYLVSSRDHGAWVSALSASASSESGWVMLGLVGAAYTGGVSSLWLLPGCFLGYCFNWFVIGPRLQVISDTYGACSIPDIFDRLHHGAPKKLLRTIRMISVGLIVILLTFYTAAQFIATGKAITVMFGAPYWVGVLLGGILVIFYATIGGLRAVSWTDVLQGAMMTISLVGLPFFLIFNQQEHFSLSLLESIDPALVDWFGGASGWASMGFIAGWIGVGLGYPGQPQVLKRFISAKNASVFRSAPWIALLWSQVAFTGAISLGILARMQFPDLSDPETALPYVAIQLLSPVFAGLILAAVFSAICSTADSQLLEAAGSLSYDAPQLLEMGSDRSHSSRIRAALVILGIIAIVLALIETQVIFTFVLYAWAALGAGFGPTISMSLLWRKTTAHGVLAGLISGPLTVVVWRSILGWNSVLYELIPAFGASCLALVVVSIFTNNDKDSTPVTEALKNTNQTADE